MENISLLEEVFSLKSIIDGSNEDESSVANPDSNSVEEDIEMTILGLKLKLRSTPTRSKNFRKRMQQIVDQGLKKLQFELNYEANDQNERDKSPKNPKLWWSDRSEALSDIIDKLNKGRSDEDPESVLKLKSQLHNLHTKSSETETPEDMESEEQTRKNDVASRKASGYILPKLLLLKRIKKLSIMSMRIEDL